MKKNILLLVLAVMLFQPSFGQITKESYEKAVDILNYHSVYYSLSVLSPTSGVTAKFKAICNCENNPAFEKIKSSIPQTEPKTIEISKEIQKLKSQDISSFNKSSILDFLLNSNFDESSIFNDFKIQLNQKGKLSDYKANLTRQLEGVFQDNIQVNTSIQKESESTFSTIDERIRAIEKNQNSKEEKSGIFGGFSDYLILLAIVLGLLGLFLALKKRDIYEELLHRILKSSRLKDLIHLQNNSTSSGMRNNNSTSSEVSDMEKRIRVLETQIEKIKSQITTSNPVSINTSQTTQPPYQEVKQPEVRLEIFFLSSPNADGSFDESSASLTYKEGATIYRFTKIGNNKANFQIDDKEASKKLALQYRDKRIDPVCEATNAFNQAKNITTVQQGEADLQSGKWVVNKKAKIRYGN